MGYKLTISGTEVKGFVARKREVASQVESGKVCPDFENWTRDGLLTRKSILQHRKTSNWLA